jgi:8-oxo-dGTP diphosphatase
MPHTYQHPRAALTVDGVVFGFDAGELKVLLIQRALEMGFARRLRACGRDAG